MKHNTRLKVWLTGAFFIGGFASVIFISPYDSYSYILLQLFAVGLIFIGLAMLDVI